jgi:hypothetical protein
MSDVDWVATGQMASAIATFVLVVVTVVYVRHTNRMASQMREQTDLLRDQVATAERSAAASEIAAKSSLQGVEEMRRTRLIDKMPVIVGIHEIDRPPVGIAPVLPLRASLYLLNAGNGVAKDL